MLKNKSFQECHLLSEASSSEEIFTPEEFTVEQLMMAELTEKYVENDVMPLVEKIEQGNFQYSIQLLKKAGELGLLGLDIPEQYGGLKLSKVSSTLITEKMGKTRSFSITYGGQVGIGSLPILYFGNEDQKKKYLPYVVAGEKIGAYALTETSSGTDALAAKTKAVLSDCGKYYILNGEKQWITNSSFADFLIIFAKINSTHFTAFIVEKDIEGVTIGAEERKMGLKGSSTCSVILEDVKVPVEQILGEIGKGHIIAFNILNIGRHKIASSCLGQSKRAIQLAVQYAKQRKQFGKALVEFPLIKQKIANMTIKTYVNESMIYRIAGMMDQELQNDSFEPIAKKLAKFATECSISKVFSTEAYDSIIDEAVQIHGGNGFMAKYEVETLYRDARVNRIFEGTNEINRILIASNLIKKTIKENHYQAQPSLKLLENEINILNACNILLDHVITSITNLETSNEQEILGAIADSAIELFALESAVLRTSKSFISEVNPKYAMTSVYAQEVIQNQINRWLSFSTFMNNPKMIDYLKELSSTLPKYMTSNSILIKREISNIVIENEKYTV